MLKIGLTSTSTAHVRRSMTARAVGSGDMAVLGTPTMIALMENAAMNAVAPFLDEGSTTVGSLMNAIHIRPTAQGDTVAATATLEEVDGRKLTFRIVASDSNGMIGEATHERFVVDRERFLSKL